MFEKLEWYILSNHLRNSSGTFCQNVWETQGIHPVRDWAVRTDVASASLRFFRMHFMVYFTLATAELDLHAYDDLCRFVGKKELISMLLSDRFLQ